MQRANKSRSNGFAIIELLIILIAVIILSAFISFVYSGIRAKERNNTRQSSINLIHDKLELYYVQNFKYPTLDNLNDSKWLATNMPTLVSSALRDPQGKLASVSNKPEAKAYAYIVTASDGSACDNSAKKCAEYTLTATLEGGGVYTKASLN